MANAVSKKWLMVMMFMVLVLVAMPLLSACGGGNNDEEEGATPSGTTSGKIEEKEFRLGELTSHSGTLEEMDQSAFMAVDEINKAGGIKVGNTTYKLKFTWKDDKTLASGAVTAIDELLSNDKCDAVDMGGNFAGGVVVQPSVEKAKKISFYWDTPDLVISPKNPYSFRIHFDLRLSNMIVLDWVRQNRPDLKKIRIIGVDAFQYTNNEPFEKKVWEEWGLDVGYTWYDFQVKDFYPVLTAALKNKPDALMITQSAGNSIIKQAKERGFKGTFILPEMVPPWYEGLVPPEDLEGLISMTPDLNSPDVPQAYKDYLVRYKNRVGSLPYSSKVFTEYTYVYLMAAALKKAGGTDSDKLKAALESGLTLEFPGGVTMDIYFFGKEFYGLDHNWQPNQYVSVTKNGKIEQKEVLAPVDQLPYIALIAKYKGAAGSYTPAPEEKVTETGGPPIKLSVDSTVGALMDNPCSMAILEKYMPKNIADPRFKMTQSLTLRTLYKISPPGSYPEGQLEAIEKDLEELCGE